jgi:hypothetical protein
MNQPYRETALALPPAPYKHSLWMRLVRWHQRLRRHFFGEYCNRRPWPCPKCGKRGNAIFIRRRVYSVPMLEPRRYQKMVEHPCCNERTHIEKPSTYYIPFSRQRREREEREWTERENRRLEMDAMECQRRAYEDAMPDQHAAGGWPLRALRPTNQPRRGAL